LGKWILKPAFHSLFSGPDVSFHQFTFYVIGHFDFSIDG